MLAGILPWLGAQLLFSAQALWASRCANVLRRLRRLPLYFAPRDAQITCAENSIAQPAKDNYARQHAWRL
ncbi:MAG: hypothetical protein EAZ37_03595 [Burkholderiales bacterium]|nr:MAG: hypothetical protein EAZ37_03595 [Burkholderiales bacterium]